MGEQQRIFTQEFFANYNGDQRHMVDNGQVFGPNLLGDQFVAIDAVYDETVNKTRVQFETVRVMAARARERLAAEVAA